MIYLAGPFFNHAQNALMDRVEETFLVNGVAFFSPRKSNHSQEVRKTGMSDKLAQRIFDLNIEQINQADEVLAVIDWALPAGQKVLLEKRNVDKPEAVQTTELEIPDSGTVWEMGYATALGTPLSIFTQSDDRKLNLMLTECARMVVRGWQGLGAYAQMLGGWKGEKG